MILGNVGNSIGADGSKSADSKAKLDDDLNRFLNLLVTQLKNQDPLDPLDTNEFTAQLVQFAGVEQQIYQNTQLEQLVGLQSNAQISSMVNFIDKTVEVIGQQFPLENSQATFTYTMPFDAKSADVIIRDQAGLTVFQDNAILDPGKHTYVWDGRNSQGQIVADGAYTAIVTGLDRQNQLLQISQSVFGRVTGVGSEGSTTSMFLGDDIEVPQTQVLTVKESPKVASN
ncbi:MAG: hypothetical protein O2944_00140 [Proteobacteria bacterium]|nr:hypothetical protein [Pseudomonadota bacterium]